MALRFCDSFDHYVTADLLKKWTTFGSSGSIAISAGNGRFGTAGLRMVSTNGPTIEKTLGSQATWIIGFSFKPSTVAATNRFFALLDSGSNQVELGIIGTGVLRLTRNGTVLATGTRVLTQNVEYYLELKVTINNTTGSYELRINGVTEFSASGVDTQNTANASANQIRLWNEGAGSTYDFDDLYVCDSSGGTNNDFLGDVRVEAIQPNGNGNSSVFVGSDGNSTDNYLLVDEAAPNDDTDYVQGSTVGDKDTYAFENVTPTTGTVYGLQILQYAKKTDAGSRSIASVARLSATEADSANLALTTTYSYLMDIRETKPGGGAWSISDVNSAEFGPKVTV